MGVDGISRNVRMCSTCGAVAHHPSNGLMVGQISWRLRDSVLIAADLRRKERLLQPLFCEGQS